MADKNQDNDEYTYRDPDAMDSHLEGSDAEEVPEAETETEHEPTPREGKNIKRNALLVLVLVLALMIGYKVFGPSSEITKPEVSVPTIQPIQPAKQSEPVQAATPAPSANEITELNHKITALETRQQTLDSNISALDSKVNNLSSNIEALSKQMASLNESLTVLSAKLETQSQQLALCATKIKEKPRQKVKHVKRRIIIPRRTYHIRAIIPGRAWLIATNGSTLTVRDGTRIPGYGVVKLIDAQQGRVLMSTGKIIGFSQQDS
jgi:intracellular multiplication protein IcmG